MEKVDVELPEAVYFNRRSEVRKLVESGFMLAPVVAVFPVGHKPLDVVQGGAVLRVIAEENFLGVSSKRKLCLELL
jgi:hypothetical protein